MSCKGSVAASALGRRGCATAAACPSADKNKEPPWWEIKQESAACRWHRGALRSRACRLVLRSVETTTQTGITSGGDSGKINRCFAIRKPERRQSQRLLCRGHQGRDFDALIKDRRPEGDLAYIHAALQERAGKSARDCQATWRSSHSGRQRAEERQRRSRERAIDQCSHRFSSLGRYI